MEKNIGGSDDEDIISYDEDDDISEEVEKNIGGSDDEDIISYDEDDDI